MLAIRTPPMTDPSDQSPDDPAAPGLTGASVGARTGASDGASDGTLVAGRVVEVLEPDPTGDPGRIRRGHELVAGTRRPWFTSASWCLHRLPVQRSHRNQEEFLAESARITGSRW